MTRNHREFRFTRTHRQCAEVEGRKPAAPLEVPCEVVAESKLAPTGRWSVTVTPVAVAGPRFVTWMTYVTNSPVKISKGVPVAETIPIGQRSGVDDGETQSPAARNDSGVTR